MNTYEYLYSSRDHMLTERAKPDQTKLCNTTIIHHGDKYPSHSQIDRDYAFVYHVAALMHTERLDPKKPLLLSEAYLYEYCMERFGTQKSWMKEGKAGLFRHICEFVYDTNALLNTGNIISPTPLKLCLIDDSIMGIADGIEYSYIESDMSIETICTIYERAKTRATITHFPAIL